MNVIELGFEHRSDLVIGHQRLAPIVSGRCLPLDIGIRPPGRNTDSPITTIRARTPADRSVVTVSTGSGSAMHMVPAAITATEIAPLARTHRYRRNRGPAPSAVPLTKDTAALPARTQMIRVDGDSMTVEVSSPNHIAPEVTCTTRTMRRNPGATGRASL